MVDHQVDTGEREAIANTLRDAAKGDFADAAPALLKTLGYESERRPRATTSVDDFLKEFPAERSDTDSERRFREATASVRVLFQVTDEEIRAARGQRALWENTDFSTANVRSFLFTAVELRGESYARGRYAAFTREINKHLNLIPSVVLFRTATDRVTLAFVRVRPNKQDPNRNVIGSVSLIREIDVSDPHPAHVRILHDLSVENRLIWMEQYGKPFDFDGLLQAWLDALDTEELNRRFYGELKAWFDRATKQARFPTGVPREQQPQRHVIRLITRLLFIWFIKEKRLVAEELFIQEQVRGLLKDYDADTGDSYYRAVLQNLFFATLNTPINERGFRVPGNARRYSRQHRVFSRYRYRAEMADPDSLVAHFDRTPFINGGLFDCLDSLDQTGPNAYRIDYFSDNVIDPGRAGYEFGALSIPNRLFFDTNGLITLFNHFKFTVEENTPAEQEVALDPELLGEVFERLLASIGEETGDNARKQFGAYYTPREVVDYMVDEALVESLGESVQAHDSNTAALKQHLRMLIDHEYGFTDAAQLFKDNEIPDLVQAIAGLRVLDPAVGSGAFPMGILHKLTLALRRLDPHNILWQETQHDVATRRADEVFWTPLREERATALQQINDTFTQYSDSDFGRKLYLIQNSIYGVDIDPNATEIAKLRFFISLAIEQDANDNPADNYGIRPLPNLETRFVTADSLLRLERPVQPPLAREAQAIQRKELELVGNREAFFHSSSRPEKLRLREKDAQLRQELAGLLREAAFPSGDAQKITDWDPMGQGTLANSQDAADWFDPEFMFGVRGGFGIVIGNPPYGQVPKGRYSATAFPYSEGRDKGKQNLYKLFVEHAYNQCQEGGTVTLIVQSSLMGDLSSTATRELLLRQTNLQKVIEFPKAAPTPGAQVFQSVTQGTCIVLLEKTASRDEPIDVSPGNDASTIRSLSFAPIRPSTIESLYPDLLCFPHIREGSVAILEKIASDPSIRPFKNYTSVNRQGDLNLTSHSSHFSRQPSPVKLLRGRHVGRYAIRFTESDEYCEPGFMADQVQANRVDIFLVCQQNTGTNDVRRLHFGLAQDLPGDFLFGNSVNKVQLIDTKMSRPMLGLLNSRFMDWFFRMTSTNNHVQGYELEQLPIPQMDEQQKADMTGLVDSILEKKVENPDADVTELESKIDTLVYALYDLKDKEIAAVEGRE